MGDRYRLVKNLFLEAVELDDTAERESFLSARCGADRALRTEVEAMLASDEVESFLEPPSTDSVRGLLRLSGDGVAVGDRVGDYELTERIASGGMGTVFKAVRADEEYEQTVAVKVMRRGPAGAELLRRFRTERQTLARLNHPGIARLLDGGATAAGRPFLVMEYVDGVRIDEHCDRERLDVRGRLALFRRICAAVHYAHQNLVVHRDLKPSNILVDGDGVPKLLDFGIAKELEPDVAQSELTRTTTRLMTPEFASPEQVRGDPVTTASDVYSLGVVLYRLLVGRSPYRLAGRLPHELERAICEQDPERPGARAAEVHDADGVTARELAARRGSDPRRLERRLAGDLDTIALKALRKEPERRYASVEQLSEDIRRHLEGLPILARKDTWTYRTGKLVRRNKLASGIAVVAAGILVAGVAGIAWSADVARAQRDQAEVESRRADLQAQAAEDEARRARLVSRLLTRLLASARPERHGYDVRVSDVLDRASSELGHLMEEEPEVEAEVRATIGITYMALGRYDEAEEHLVRAHEILRNLHGDEHVRTARSMYHLGSLRNAQGELAAAEDLVGRALTTMQRQGETGEETSSALSTLGTIQSARGEYASAEESYRAALAIRRRIDAKSFHVAGILSSIAATYYASNRKLEEAERLLEEAMDIAARTMPAEHVTVAMWMANLGMIKLALGKTAESYDLQTRALEIRRKLLPPTHPDLAMNMIAVGEFDVKMGRFAEAEKIVREALDIQVEALGPTHPDLVASYYNLLRTLVPQGRLDEAEEAGRKALELARSQLGNDHPDLARALAGLAYVHKGRGDYTQAESDYRAALEILLEHSGSDNLQTALVYNSLGRLYYDRRDYARALEMYEALLGIRRRLLSPGNSLVADALWSTALMRVKTGDCETAVGELRDFVRSCEATEEAGARRKKALGLSELGACLAGTGEYEEAERALVECFDIFDAELGRTHQGTVLAMKRLVRLYGAWGRTAEEQEFRNLLDELGLDDE